VREMTSSLIVVSVTGLSATARACIKRYMWLISETLDADPDPAAIDAYEAWSKRPRRSPRGSRNTWTKPEQDGRRGLFRIARAHEER